MARFRGRAWKVSGLSRVLVAALTLGTFVVPAQTSGTAVPGAETASAAVSGTVKGTQSDMLEVATVVLTFTREPVDSVKPEQFDLRVGGGQPFHPTRAHIEGDEPLHLAFLIDDSRDPLKALPEYGDALAKLVPGSLHATDHVSVYALDCAVARSMADSPADAEALKNGVANALSYAKLHGGAAKPSCSGTLRLWDYAAVAIDALGKLPGRRVLVIVSGGNDKKSSNDWKAVRDLALRESVAIFGLRDQGLFDADEYVPTYSAGGRIGVGADTSTPKIPRNFGEKDQRSFDLLCANTGGLILNTVPSDVSKSLSELMRIVRGRYVLEFPRGGFTPDGSHVVNVSVGTKGYFVAAAGAGDPLGKTVSP